MAQPSTGGMLDYILVFCISFLGGLLQAVTGFGAGIVIMIALPNVLPMNVAPAVSNTICTPLAWSIAAKYRKSARYKLIFIPAIFYLAASTVAIKLSTIVNLEGLKIAFGVVLVVLAIYFMCFANKVQVRGSLLSAFACCTVSGILSGFFGIGGPLLVLYFLAITDGKEEYLGTINGLFSLTTAYQVVLRIAAGILTWQTVPYIVIGIAAILLGRVLGAKVVDKLNADRMKKAIYLFLAVSGVITIIQAL